MLADDVPANPQIGYHTEAEIVKKTPKKSSRTKRRC
jgi:hypothetical protein